ncbi:MAG TPA: hypothetical protein VGM84_21405 [Steroidobacteraceae bacterium]
MSAAELRYGIAPIPDGSVAYQPDVIVVGGGAEAIRAESSDGLRWTIDGAAPRARDLVPGKVFFMTGRAVGRVLDVRPEGANLIVTVGPVDLTELVREAHIHIKAMPVDFSQAVAYSAPGLPGQVVPLPVAQVAPTGKFIPAAYLPASNAVPDVSNLVHFKAEPSVSSSGLGMSVSSDGGGLKVRAETTVRLDAPKLDVNIDIAPRSGGVADASVELTGATGLAWKFQIGTDVGLKANVNGILQPATDFSIFVGGIGPLPVCVTVRQRFMITTSLGVRNSTLSANGDYAFNGGFKVGYVGKRWSIAGPVGFHANRTILQTASGITMAASGVDLTNQLQVIAGVGTHGFAAGPYFSFTSTIGLFKGSDLGMIPCREATLVIKLNGGVGYVIPQAVTDAINSILSALNIKYSIRGEGGLQPRQAATIVEKTSTLPGCHASKT